MNRYSAPTVSTLMCYSQIEKNWNWYKNNSNVNTSKLLNTFIFLVFYCPIPYKYRASIGSFQKVAIRSTELLQDRFSVQNKVRLCSNYMIE